MEADTGNGHVVSAQLRRYLQTNSSSTYMYHTVFRLAALAKEIRFNEHKQHQKQQAQPTQTEEKLREKWQDPTPTDHQQAFDGLIIYWDEANPGTRNGCRS